METITLDTSWLHRKYENGEINTRLPYVAVNDPDYFVQGSEAELVIDQIHQIWINGDLTEEEAFNKWINLNL